MNTLSKLENNELDTTIIPGYTAQLLGKRIYRANTLFFRESGWQLKAQTGDTLCVGLVAFKPDDQTEYLQPDLICWSASGKEFTIERPNEPPLQENVIGASAIELGDEIASPLYQRKENP